MAITCSWSKPLGTCYSKYDKENLITIYGGGNSLAVFCDPNKNLVNFIIDIPHFKRCQYKGDEYTDIKIYLDRKTEAERLMKCLNYSKFNYQVINKKEIKNND